MKERLIAAVIALLIVLPILVYGGTVGVLILGLAIVGIGSGELWNMFTEYVFQSNIAGFSQGIWTGISWVVLLSGHVDSDIDWCVVYSVPDRVVWYAG